MKPTQKIESSQSQSHNQSARLDASHLPPPASSSCSSSSSSAVGNLVKSFQLPSSPANPAQILTTDTRVAEWAMTPGFQAFLAWLKRRCHRLRGKEILPLEGYKESFEAVKTLMQLLNAMIKWVDEIPPQPQSSQRFGNLAFRDYIKLVEKRLPSFFISPRLPQHLPSQLLPLLLNSHAFGHPTRLDYGTGHELAFVLGLWCVTVSGWVAGEEEQDELILRVFPRYLELVTLLQWTYRLEPAGSHGVWGLDDYCFLPYLFGSAQLLGVPGSTPSSALSTALSLSSAPQPHITADTDPSSRFTLSPQALTPQITDMYTLSLYRITLFKSGASFAEHSPLLYSLSQLPSWSKPHSGLIKMFLGEVVGKKVVVQGLWIGGWCWGEDLPTVVREKDRADGSDEEEKKGNMGTGTGMGMGTTAAPWKDQRSAEAANRTWAAATSRQF